MHHGWTREMRDEWRAARREWHDEMKAQKKEWHERRHAWGKEMRDRLRGAYGHGHGPMHSSGNAAFDEYKAETLRRLEEEQAEFTSFLDNLRKARDKAEFDQFMASRRDDIEAERNQGSEDQPQSGVNPDNGQQNY